MGNSSPEWPSPQPPSLPAQPAPPHAPAAKARALKLVGVSVVVAMVVLGYLAGPFRRYVESKMGEAAHQAKLQTLQVPLTEEEQIIAEEFAKKLLDAVEKKDSAKVNASVDYDFMADEVFHGFTGAVQMKKGMLDTVTQNPGGIFHEFFGQPGRVVRHWKRDGVPAITLRFTPEAGGAAYIDILLRRQSAGGFKVYEVYTYLFGLRMSAEMRKMTAILMGADAGMLAQILGRAGRKKDLDDLVKMAKAGREGRPEEVISIYKALSPEMMSQPGAFVQYVRALQLMGDGHVDEYVTALEKARGILGADVTIDLLLVDRHILREDFVAARKAVEASLQTIGDDSFLHHLRGMMCVRTNDLPAARDSLKRAEALEPDLFDLVDLKMQIRAAEKDYAGVISTIQAFKSRTGADITPDLLTEPVYDGFKKSPEYAAWVAAAKKAP